MACTVEYRRSAPDHAKANDLASEALKQLLTLAGALLALTITFIKDFLGSGVAHASCFFLVPVGWVFLFASIWCGWVGLADAARRMGTGDCEAYVFGSGKPRVLARLAQWTFFAGLACLILFATLNFKQPSASTGSGEGGKAMSAKLSDSRLRNH